MTTTSPPLTVGAIAKRLGVKVHRVCYALTRNDITPAHRVGVLRLFHEEQLPAIQQAIAEAEKYRQPRGELIL